MILLKKVQKGLINLDNFVFNIKTAAAGELTVDQQLVLLYELRYKGELRAAAAKIQVLVGEKGKDFRNEVWNDHAQVSLVNAAKYFIQFVIVKNFYDFINGSPILDSGKSMKQRAPELQNMMSHLYQTYATYWLLDEVQTFYETMPPNNEHLTYFFGGKKSKIEGFQDLLKANISIIGMSAKDITDGFDFDDRELLSVIAKKDIKESD